MEIRTGRGYLRLFKIIKSIFKINKKHILLKKGEGKTLKITATNLLLTKSDSQKIMST